MGSSGQQHRVRGPPVGETQKRGRKEERGVGLVGPAGLLLGRGNDGRTGKTGVGSGPRGCWAARREKRSWASSVRFLRRREEAGWARCWVGRKKTKNPFAILFSNPNLNVNQIKFEYGLNFFEPDQVKY